MDPVYKSMHSFPYHVDQTHFGPYSLPRFEAAPTQFYANPLRPQLKNECWPWGSKCCSAYPAAYHGCGNHSYVPYHYSWSSPYSYVPPIHSTRSYHSFPFQYMPSPHCPMEQPQYEYEKHGQRDHHCCGCPNHSCHPMEERDVKIEEEEKHGQRIKIDSPDPFQLSRCPYPIVWHPPNDGPRNPLDCRNLKEDSNDAKPFKKPNMFEQRPTVWNGWYPFDLNNFESFKKKEDDQNHQDEYKDKFPFPVFWTPYTPEENVNNPEPRSELVKHSDRERNKNGNGEHANDQASLRAKSILSMADEILRNNEKESEPVKVTIDNADEKFSRNDYKKNSSSPKSSKLPPVCLRVEPLMRKNGRSRSLSPPDEKQKSDKMSNEQSEAVPLTGNGKTEKIANNELKKGEGITKIIEVVDGNILRGESVDAEVGTPVNLSLSCQRSISTKERNINGKCTETDTSVVKGQSEDAGSAKGENAEVETKVVVIADEADKPTKTEWSKEEAAIVIQSAYRGFNVRRWEPVKKLKQIAKVREQIAVVNNLIRALELSTDIKTNSKQRNIIAETIMNLLLKLDTIQGLHHSIREVRKYAVRDLVNLQEKLDSLINENSEASPGLCSASETNEDALDVLALHNGNETCSDLENVAVGIPENFVNEVTESTSESTMKNEDDQSDQVHDEDAKVSFSNSNLPLNSESGESEARNASMSDEALDKPLEMKIPIQQECHLEEGFSLINDSSNFDKASDIIRAEVVEGKPEHNRPESEKSYDQQENAISNINNPIDVTDAQKLRLEQEISLTDDLANIDEASDIIGTEMAAGKPDHDRIDSDKSSDQRENATPNLENHMDVFDAQECCLEPETSLIDDLENIVEASDVIEAEVAGGRSEHDGIDKVKSSSRQETATVNIDNNHIDIIDEPHVFDIDRPVHEACEKENGGTENSPARVEMPSELTQDSNQKHLVVKENFEVQGLESLNGNEENADTDVLNHTEIKHAVDIKATCQAQVNQPLSKVSLASDEMKKSNTKLIEENERLRDMMEKLMKSGQEQLSAISFLSGRVKALEKRLSRKKKLKTKRCRTPSSEYLAHDTL